ncbi:MAG: glycine betaine ABC transporter substrate-binding protein [Dehalococcoidia bacterium]
MSTRLSRILGAALVLFTLVFLVAGCSGPKPVIVLHAWETDSHFLNNAIFKFIVEEGYEYPVETVVETTPVMQEALPKGEVDLNLEGWQQNIPEWYEEQIEKGNIVNLGMTFEGGPQFFIIPKWVAEEYNIKTVFDMKDHWDLFQDPEDPTKGLFYNCTIGSQCAKINEVKLEAYGLARYYNLVSPPSYGALEAALSKPQERHQPVFGYYWAPNALMGGYEWHILEEPPYTAACWERVLAASDDKSPRPVDQACAYETLPIEKVAHKGLLKKAPDVVEMLEKMNVGLEALNETLAWADENDVQEWERAAIYYLENYEDRWKAWVAPEAYERIKKALEEAAT